MNKKEIKEKWINQYNDQLYTYKHTFKQNADGSYYWVSTEPIK